MMEKKEKKKKRKGKQKEKTCKDKVKEFFSSTLFLSIVFIILLIIVIFLMVLVHQKRSSEKQDNKANIVIPIYKADADFEFSISAIDLKKSNKYTFKVVNYMKDIVSEEDISYTITIKNPTDSVITLVRNDEENNLMKSQKETILENETLSSKEEDEVFYYVRFKKIGKLKNTDLITIHIAS